MMMKSYSALMTYNFTTEAFSETDVGNCVSGDRLPGISRQGALSTRHI
jgi:hypothetical protein